MTHDPARSSNRFSTRKNNTSRLLTGIVVGILAATSSAVQAAEPAPSPQAQHQYDIPPGTLDGALKAFASQAGIMLSVDASLTAGKTTPGLKGNYAVAQGFEALLAGSGLHAVANGGDYSLQALPAATNAAPAAAAAPTSARALGKITVTTEEAADGSAEQGFRSDIVSSVGPWEGRSLQDTPYSITTISSDLIEDLQATTPDQIYRVVPTLQFIRPQHENDQSQVNMRGFWVISTYLDGLRNSDSGFGVTTEDAESIEVFTGLSGFLYGPGNVGGMINYVSKRPTAERLNRLTLGNSGGSNYYAQGDFGGPIDSDGRVGYRINGIWQGGDTVIDDQDLRKRFISGAFDWHVTDSLLWQFDAAYRDYEVHGLQPLWVVGAGATRPSADDIDGTALWGQPWLDQWDKTQRYGTQLRWDANDLFSLRAAWKYLNTRRSSTGALNLIQPDGTYMQIDFGKFAPGDNSQVLDDYSSNGQVFADFNFGTGSVTHKLTTGVQYRRYWNEGFTQSAPSIIYTGLPLDRPTHMDEPVPEHVDRGPRGTTNEYSYTTLLVGDDITFNESWSLLAGAARSTIDIEPTTFLSAVSGYKKSAVTPNLSLIYKPIEALTAYATYIESLEQGGTASRDYNGVPVANAGELFEPLISKQYEIGAKWSVGGMLLTTALFQIDRALQYYDLSNPGTVRFVQDGREVHRGIELTAFGKLTDDLTLTGGLTLFDAEVKEQQQDPLLEGKRPTDVAERIAKLRAEYRLPLLPALKLTGAISYTGSQYADAMNTDRLPSFTLFDVGARYEASMGQHPLTLRLDVNNLTDKAFWNGSVSRGAPRTFLFSVSTDL